MDDATFWALDGRLEPRVSARRRVVEGPGIGGRAQCTSGEQLLQRSGVLYRPIGQFQQLRLCSTAHGELCRVERAASLPTIPKAARRVKSPKIPQMTAIENSISANRLSFILLVLLPASSLFNSTMSSFSRVFQRTARSAFQYQRGVNPVQNALGAQGTGRWMNGVRNYAAFTRDKPHVNIGMSPLNRCVYLCLTQSRYHWPRRPRKGTAPPLPPEHLRVRTQHTLIAHRPPSLPPSQSVRPRRATPSSSSTAPSTRLLRSASVVSPSPPPTSSTRPTTATMPTSTALVTPITSRT